MVAKWATIRYTDDHILDYMEVDASHAIFEVEVPKDGSERQWENSILEEDMILTSWQ